MNNDINNWEKYTIVTADKLNTIETNIFNAHNTVKTIPYHVEEFVHDKNANWILNATPNSIKNGFNPFKFVDGYNFAFFWYAPYLFYNPEGDVYDLEFGESYIPQSFVFSAEGENSHFVTTR